MAARDRVVYAILKFLTTEIASPDHTEDAKEGLEVAKQCLETAYSITVDSKKELELGVGLEELIASVVPPPRKQASEEEKKQGEALKTEGNDHMKAEKFQEAVEAYTKAIEKDNNNAIYYSNRAAAFNKLNRFYEAVDDCDEAIAIDPNYSKAYGRKGLALSGLNQHGLAIESYKRAIELDPNNENFKTNLEIAEEKARTASAPGGGMGGMGGMGSLLGGGGGMPDLASVMNNPAMMQMASQMMQTPGMQQMMNNFMTGVQGNEQPPPGGPAPGSAPPGGAPPSGMPPGGMPPGGMENLMRAGQQFAEQMQRTNPELVDQLRNQFQGGTGGDPNTGDGSQS